MDNAKDYVERKGWEYRLESAGEEIVCKVCPICGNENWNFYINNNTGLYQCWICAPDNKKGKGHLSSLKQFMGDIIPLTKVSKVMGDREDPDFTQEVLKFHKALMKTPSAIKYLLKRHISEEIIDKFKLGYTVIYGQEVISIPSWEDGVAKLIKFRKFGEDVNTQLSKYLRKKGSKSILLKTIDKSDEVILVEGEIDGLTLMSKGYDNVIANTGGATTLLPEWYDYLKEIPKIYVCYDNDGPGQKSAKEVVAKRLGFGRVLNIELPENINDVNEFFCKGGKKEDFDKLIEKAKPFSLPGVLSIEDALGELYRKYTEGDEGFLPTPWKKVNKLLGGGLRKKELMVLGAPPKIGKTTFALQIAFETAKKGIPVLFFCLEMPFESIAKLVVCMNEEIYDEEFNPQLIGVYADKIANIPLYLGYEPRITIEQLIETFKEAQNRYGIELAIFDNLHWLVRSMDNIVAEVGNATKAFKTLAMEMDIPLILIAQPRKLKNSNKPMNYWDLKDSSAIPADADVLCVLHRNRIMEVDAEGVMRKVQLAGDVNQSFESKTLFRVDAGRMIAGGQTFIDYEGGMHKFFEEE